MRAEVSAMTLAGPAAELDRVRAGLDDLRAAGKITADIGFAEAEALEVRDVTLVPVVKD
jgi:valyl-tRNA synthetase